MEIRKLNISELKPAIYNPRKDLKPSDPEYQKLKRSIDEFGYVEPITWNKRSGNVVSGHQRLKVLIAEGLTEIDVVVVDEPEDREKALNIALNKIRGDWDLPQLKDLLEDLDTGAFDMALTGFDTSEIEALMNQFHVETVVEDDFDVDAAIPEVPITKRGDVYILGKHRLMCGDSTVITDVEKLMDGKKADMFLTDPPYNVNYTGKTKQKLTIQSDTMLNTDFKQFLQDAFTSDDIVMKAGAVFYIWHADLEGLNFRMALYDIGWKVRQCLIWNKNTLVMGRFDYHWKHEPCLYGWKEGSSHLWASDRKQTTVIDFNRPSRSTEHPTMKPIGLFDYQIKNNTKGDDIVLDLFMGSGTTIMACEQNGRIGYGMELDEKYCDVIIQRWETFTGQKAELVS